MAAGPTPVRCWVYRGRRQPETYLYLPAADALERVPEALLERLGPLELALSFELTPGRKLARADPDRVLRALEERGYYLQMPPPRSAPPADGR